MPWLWQESKAYRGLWFVHSHAACSTRARIKALSIWHYSPCTSPYRAILSATVQAPHPPTKLSELGGGFMDPNIEKDPQTLRPPMPSSVLTWNSGWFQRATLRVTSSHSYSMFSISRKLGGQQVLIPLQLGMLPGQVLIGTERPFVCSGWNISKWCNFSMSFIPLPWRMSSLPRWVAKMQWETTHKALYKNK